MMRRINWWAFLYYLFVAILAYMASDDVTSDRWWRFLFCCAVGGVSGALSATAGMKVLTEVKE